MCKICGGPNHQGCGCEAKRQANAMVEIENSHKVEQPESEAPAESETDFLTFEKLKSILSPKVEQLESETPAESETDEALESVLSPEAIIQSHESNMRMAKDIQTMADGFEGLCACFYDTNNLLKIIAGDLITIRKFLTKEDEVKNADPEKPEENQN